MTNAIELKNVSKRYTGFALQDICFAVPQGSIVGFVGENGAGKTTTIKSILDVVHIDSGEICLFGKPNTGKQAHMDIGVVFDECSFHDWLRAEQVGNFLKGVYPTWDSSLFSQLLARFGLKEKASRKEIIKTYSRGMKMKLSLAAAMAHRPKLLILDEATSGLDPIVRDEILDMFMEFIQDEEHSILFSSHITSDIEKAADYLIFIHQGKVIINQEKDELLNQYGLVHCSRAALPLFDEAHIKGSRITEFGAEVLIDNRPTFKPQEGMVVDKATVDDIMLYTVRGINK